MPSRDINRNAVVRGMHLEAETIAYMGYLTVAPSIPMQIAINNLVKLLKITGNWWLLDRMWLLANETQQAATISLVNPSSTAITEVNAPSWVAKQGYTGNGTTSYLNLNFDLTTATQYSLDSSSLGVYLRTNAQSTGNDMGTQNSGGDITQLLARFTDDIFYTRINNTSAAGTGNVSNTNSTGLISAARTSSSTILTYRNGVQLDSDAVNSTAVPAPVVYALCRNNNGTATAFTTRQTSIIFIGSGSINQSLLFTAVESFMDEIASGVIS